MSPSAIAERRQLKRNLDAARNRFHRATATLNAARHEHTEADKVLLEATLAYGALIKEIA